MCVSLHPGPTWTLKARSPLLFTPGDPAAWATVPTWRWLESGVPAYHPFMLVWVLSPHTCPSFPHPWSTVRAIHPPVFEAAIPTRGLGRHLSLSALLPQTCPPAWANSEGKSPRPVFLGPSLEAQNSRFNLLVTFGAHQTRLWARPGPPTGGSKRKRRLSVGVKANWGRLQ